MRVLAVLAAALFSFNFFTPQAAAAFDGADFSNALAALVAANPNVDMTAVTNALMANANLVGQKESSFDVNLGLVAAQFGLNGVTFGQVTLQGYGTVNGAAPAASNPLVAAVVAAYTGLIGSEQDGAKVAKIITDENNKIIAAINAAGGGAAGLAAYVETLVYDGTYAATTGNDDVKKAAAEAAANAAVEEVVKTIFETEQKSGNGDSSGAKAAAASATLMLIQRRDCATVRRLGYSQCRAELARRQSRVGGWFYRFGRPRVGRLRQGVWRLRLARQLFAPRRETRRFGFRRRRRGDGRRLQTLAGTRTRRVGRLLVESRRKQNTERRHLLARRNYRQHLAPRSLRQFHVG
jgi:hypothetical protein